MKALVAHAPGDYRLEEIPVPRAGKGEIVIKVEACGICAGDLKAFHGAPSFWGGDGSPPYIKVPVVPGHEFIGNVAEIGEDAGGGFAIGDRVISEQIVPCGECRFCKTGKYWMCQKHDLYGFQTNVNGGMAEYMKFTKEGRNYRVPDGLPIEEAILIEPYACSWHCVERANPGVDDVVVLSGAGTLGLGMAGAIRLRNPKLFIALDMKDDRLALAKEFGADMVLNPGREDAVKKVRELTDGYGCDIYIEATGHPSSVAQGLEMIRRLGTFVEFSVFGSATTCDWSIIGDRKELDVLGSHLGPYSYDKVIDRIANGRLPTKGVVTHSFPLERWAEAFSVAEKGDASLKVILKP
jgi:threonine dehydrogenase-like Zn-dependent dehydrogenase